MSLFTAEPIRLPLKHAEARYFPNFLENTEQIALLTFLKENVQWTQGEIKLFGKTYAEPRLVAWFSQYPYGYSGIKLSPTPIPDEIKRVQQKIEALAGYQFNGVLVNYYRNGNDSMGWHADNESNLGLNPTIASVNLGQSRIFHLKSVVDNEPTFKLELEGGSLLLMEKNSQTHYKHQLPKSKTKTGERINLTFRWLI
ncbi:MAG: alpha-ketoglutarate-dependent dioxygenase AlkB family protein [Luteibaculaceae bacterium]